ncbi:MAG TPA: hypothetical protein VEA77_02425 [Hyphomicrobium sp.]|nr:hypothetical protein [Hyphomicrobium sp.]
MKLMTRGAAAFAVLSVAAIPVGALTIKNISSNEVSVAVDTGAIESVYKVPAGGSVDVKEDCSEGCAVTGPWGYSRMVSQNDAIETDGAPLVTMATKDTASRGLVPENPGAADATPVSSNAKAAAPTPSQSVKKASRKSSRKAGVKQASKKGPAAGTFMMLFQGPKT